MRNPSSLAQHAEDAGKNPARATETRLLVVAALIAAIVVIATAVSPTIDIALARQLTLSPDSTLRPVLSVVRQIFRVTPLAILVGVAFWLAAAAVRGSVERAVAVRRGVFMAALFAVGPGLLVNAGLKTHAHRPRPIQTVEIAGGEMPFRPFYRFDGACRTNCSFSSGEAASAFWTTAPALLAPPALRVAAVGMALGFGALVSAFRLILGAHFLSDIAFSAFATILLTLAGRRLFRLP